MIQPSCSPFASPIILARKKTRDWRLCMDYRCLNALRSKTNTAYQWLMNSWMNYKDLNGSQVWTLVQVITKFPWTMWIFWKRLFKLITTIEYWVMPYGVTGGPATFQLTMNSILAPFLRKCVVIFIDDILIFSSSWLDHLKHLKAIFSVLDQHQFKVKMFLCSKFTSLSLSHHFSRWSGDESN